MLVTATYTRYTLGLQYTHAEIGGQFQAVARYRIVRNDGAYCDFDTEMVQMYNENVLPKIASAPYTTAPGMNQFLRVRSIAVEQMADGLGTGVVVNVQLSTMYARNRDTLTEVDLPSSWEYNAVTRATPIYRKSWTTAPPQNLDESATDIGGTPFAGGQVTRSQMITQVRARLRLVADATVDSMQNAATKLTTYQGKTNSAVFSTFPINSLVCEGVNIGKLDGEFYQIIFDFLFDPWYHHEQLATVDVDGRIKLTSGVPTEVKWKRQVRTATDFNAIWNANTRLKNLTEKGYY